MTQLKRVLGLWDIVAMNIVAVVGLRWITRSARAGESSVTLWILAWLLFFLPLAAAVVELSSRHPEQGGLYAWTRRAFGPVHGFICGWCLWVNNLFYFPALLLFAAANLLVLFGPAASGLADSRLYAVTFVLVTLWGCVGLNLLGLGAGRLLQSAGSVATWIPAALLIVAGAVAFATVGSASTFSASTLLPRTDVLATISLWSAMCFAFSGFEIGGLVSEEVKDARRTIPRAILISGVAITVIYVVGSASVLVAVPADTLKELSGIADAVEHAGGQLGLVGMGALTGGLLALGSIAGNNSWFGGAARVPFAAGVHNVLPPAFARLHPRHHTPVNAILMQGVAATAIFLLSLFVSITGGQHEHPGGVRHPGEPHHPGVLRALPVSVPHADSPAEARRQRRPAGRDAGAGRDGWPVAGRDRRLSGDRHVHRARLRAAARHGERAQLRSEPDRPVGPRDRRRNRAVLVVDAPNQAGGTEVPPSELT